MNTCKHCGRAFEPSAKAMRNRNYRGDYCSVRCSNAARSRPVAERFWEKVDRSGGPDACWPWLAARDRDGYGLFAMTHSQQRMAHVVAYELTKGVTLADGAIGCHTCDAPPCCNPAHVFEGTPALNAQDRNAKGRQARGNLPRLIGSHHGMARLTEADVPDIRARYAAGESQQAIADHYRVTQVNVSAIVRRKTWRHVP